MDLFPHTHASLSHPGICVRPLNSRRVRLKVRVRVKVRVTVGLALRSGLRRGQDDGSRAEDRRFVEARMGLGLGLGIVRVRVGIEVDAPEPPVSDGLSPEDGSDSPASTRSSSAGPGSNSL